MQPLAVIQQRHTMVHGTFVHVCTTRRSTVFVQELLRSYKMSLSQMSCSTLKPPLVCCCSGFLFRAEPRGLHGLGRFTMARHVLESQPPLPCYLVEVNYRHEGCWTDPGSGASADAKPCCIAVCPGSGRGALVLLQLYVRVSSDFMWLYNTL